MRERFASEYADLERWHWWFRGRRRILAALLRRRLAGDDGRSRTIISVGSGDPRGLAWIRPFAGPDGHVIGVDADPAGVLRQTVDAADGASSFVVAAMGRLPLRDGIADVALALDVIEHIEDDARALRSAYATLRPGGLLLVTVPAFMSLWGEQDVVSDHVRRYTRRTLRDASDRAGLPEPEIGYFNFFLFPPIAAVRWGRRLLRPPSGDTSDFEMAEPGLVNDVLARVFAAERHLVGRVPLPVGVSLYAAVRAPE